jgi:hypothetical protein
VASFWICHDSYVCGRDCLCDEERLALLPRGESQQPPSGARRRIADRAKGEIGGIELIRTVFQAGPGSATRLNCGTGLLHDRTRGGIVDAHPHHQRAQYFVPRALERSGAVRPVIHRDQTEYRPAREGDAETRIAIVLGIDIPLFQPGNLKISARNVVDLRLPIRLPLAAERFAQRIVERQLPNVLGWNPEDGHSEIAAFDRWRPVVKMHRTLARLDDPVARAIESHQTAVDNANGKPRLALPGVIVFQFEIFDVHIRILQANRRHASGLRQFLREPTKRAPRFSVRGRLRPDAGR